MMRNALRILTVLILGLTIGSPESYAKKKSDGEAHIKLEESTFNFGIIDEKGGPVSHEFEFINTGTGNLVIYDVRTQCGCTRPEYPKNPIAPGKKGKIKITFLPQGRVGSLNKAATIYTNGKPSKTEVRIKGSVVPKK